jgi:hypothetical protein
MVNVDVHSDACICFMNFPLLSGRQAPVAPAGSHHLHRIPHLQDFQGSYQKSAGQTYKAFD